MEYVKDTSGEKTFLIWGLLAILVSLIVRAPYDAGSLISLPNPGFAAVIYGLILTALLVVTLWGIARLLKLSSSWGKALLLAGIKSFIDTEVLKIVHNYFSFGHLLLMIAGVFVQIIIIKVIYKTSTAKAILFGILYLILGYILPDLAAIIAGVIFALIF